MPKITEKGYNAPKVNRSSMSSGSLTVLMVLAIFVMLPFTQFLTGLREPDTTVRSFDVAPPPPQSPPPDPPPPEEPEPDDSPPEMEPPPPQLSLSQLDMAVEPGLGNALAGDMGMSDIGVDSTDTLDEISLFEISELDEPVRELNSPNIAWPQRMRRERVPGYVHLEGVILEDGSVEYLRTIEASHPEYEETFIRYMNQLRYSQPRVGGEAVQARLVLQVPIEWR